MTTFDTAYTDNGHTDHEAPAEQGSQAGVSSPRRAATRRTNSRPAWVEFLDNPHVRRLVAGEVEIRADELTPDDEPTPHTQADHDRAGILLALAERLRAG